MSTGIENWAQSAYPPDLIQVSELEEGKEKREICQVILIWTRKKGKNGGCETMSAAAAAAV